MTPQTNTPQDGGDAQPKGDDYVYEYLMHLHRQRHLVEDCFCTTEVAAAYKTILTECQAREREARIDAVQLYMDTCEKEGVPPSWRNLREFQRGQHLAYEHLHSKPQAGDGEGI